MACSAAVPCLLGDQFGRPDPRDADHGHAAVVQLLARTRGASNATETEGTVAGGSL